mgnify:CR=1 FL=1
MTGTSETAETLGGRSVFKVFVGLDELLRKIESEDWEVVIAIGVRTEVEPGMFGNRFRVVVEAYRPKVQAGHMSGRAKGRGNDKLPNGRALVREGKRHWLSGRMQDCGKD